jgi:hypothetical protein
VTEGAVSLYQLHRCVWDQLRCGEVGRSNGHVAFDAGGYDLTAEERTAFQTRDVAALYRLGLHPVLLNALCRASGYSRDDYRSALADFAEREERTARWQR